MTRDDARALRRPLVLLVLLVAAAAAVLHFMWQRVEQADRRLQREAGLAREAQMRLQLSGREREVIEQNLGPYRALERAGFVAPEQRINWVSGLRDANQDAGLFGIEYQIGAQRAYARAAELDAPQLEVHESPMRLKTSLLHEEDLLRLFAALDARNLGLFLVEECTLKRVPGAGDLRYRPQLDAECQIAWLTAHPKTGATGP